MISQKRMEKIMKLINSEYIFWLAWIVIPLIIEIVPALGNFFTMFLLRFRNNRKFEDLEYYPEVTVIIPVYNSQETLYRCIKSINDNTYSNDNISVILVDNGSKDDSFEVYKKCQMDFVDLTMYWMSSNQGKSRALNKALYSASGKYIINIDSDGYLEENAIMNVVIRFENDLGLHCATGVILTDKEEIDDTEGFWLRQFRKLEYIEYAQAFLAGRSFNSEWNTLYTISGAFSAFRKSTILQTFMYNTDTICEDTHITFQIKKQNKRIFLCEDAIYYTSPIEDVAKLYTQRQRWQIGELEVFHMFFENLTIRKLRKDNSYKTLLFDHTFAFPRLIWYFALMALGIMNYSLKSVGIAVLLIYAMYVITGFLFYLNINFLLKKFKEEKKYYRRKLLYVFLYPLYNMFTFFIRFSGIINSITRKSSWKTYTFKEEIEIAKNIIKNDFSFGNWKRKRERKYSANDSN